MDVNSRAPVVARVVVEIEADPQTVWDVLADLERWPDWNPDIRELSLNGPLTPGTKFFWRAGRSRITSQLLSVDPPSEIGWRGRTFGIDAIDVFRLEPTLRGGTLVSEEESWSGLPARLFRKRLRRLLQDSLAKGLRSLKTEAERRAAARHQPRRQIA
jgi:hypothetical protein